MMERFTRYCTLLFFCAIVSVSSALQADPPHPANEAELEQQRRQTAVTLNYCRAAFHRIKQAPSKRVLLEEREKILNNLNLNGIADEDVMKLYGVVLSEISEVQIAENEQTVIQDKYKRLVRHQIAGSAFEFGLEIASAQYLDALRTGANSWWDYRSTKWNRDLDTWKVEKDRMKAVVGKSSMFLDTFWKLAHKRQIPDRWLVRGTDLDKLEVSVLEPNPEVRLRVLKRMEPFMECYPPYWYYTARTQQASGQLTAAMETYGKLANLGEGQFRKDEMLAAGLANLSAIQAHLRQPGAIQSAERALRYSTDAWQVNLMCAQVLKDHIRYDQAEDAILRNLDEDLELGRSTTNLVSLYVDSGNKQKLVKHLGDPKTVRMVAVPVLLRAAAFVGTEELPGPAMAQLGASLYGYPDARYGRGDFVFVASGAWNLQKTRLSLKMGERTVSRPEIKRVGQNYQIRFRQLASPRGGYNRGTSNGAMTLAIQYPRMEEIRLQLAPSTRQVRRQQPRTASGFGFKNLSVSLAPQPRTTAYRLASIQMGQTSMAFVPAGQSRMIKKQPEADALTTPEISISVTTEKQPTITPTYVLPANVDEDLLSDEIQSISILEVDLEPADAGDGVTRDAEELAPPPKEKN